MKKILFLLSFVFFSNLSLSEVKKLYCKDSDNYSVTVQYDEKTQIIKFEGLIDNGRGLITNNFIIWEDFQYLEVINRVTGKLRYFNKDTGSELGQMSCSSNKNFKMF